MEERIVNSLKRFFLLTGIIFMISSCEKEKIDFSYDNVPEEISNSGIRFINIGEYKDVIVDGDTLTYKGKSWLNGNPPTAYFPTPGGLLDQNWVIPKAVFEGKSIVEFQLLNRSGQSMKFQMSNPENRKLDYYTVNPIGSGQPAAISVPRDETAPSRPDHFKIRILNLMKILPQVPVFGENGPLENLYGSITLTYADGTPVSTATTNVSLSQRVSDYIEVPYGTYQFRILTADGRQISAAVHGVNKKADPFRKFDPSSSRIEFFERSRVNISASTYAPLASYEPGGVYTIVVTPQTFSYFPWISSSQTVDATQNQFQIIKDLEVPSNLQFFKVQAIHAASYGPVRVRIDGEQFPSMLSFGENSAYQIMTVSDSISCEVLDSKGQVLVKKQISARGNQNISLWIGTDNLEKLQLIPVYNDLSKDSYIKINEDYGEHNRFEKTSYTGLRFLNLCPDEPLINFASANGQEMPRLGLFLPQEPSRNIFNNLYTNTPKTDLPYLYWDEQMSYMYAFGIYAYRSVPNITPGTWIPTIPVLSYTDFVSNPQLYSQVGREVPYFQSGIYTIALIGRTKENTNYDARIILVKHSN